MKRFDDRLYKVFDRGEGTKAHTSRYMLLPTHERTLLTASALLELLETARFTRKGLLFGIADEEGDLTYYEASVREPAGIGEERRGGTVPEGEPAGEAARTTVTMMGDRGFVFDPAGAGALHADGFYGKPVGEALQLSLLEALHLLSAGRVRVLDGVEGAPVSPAELAGKGEKLQDEFALRRVVYADLRRRGLTTKTGFKYGTHFRAYRGDPMERHSEYLVHAVAGDSSLPWTLVGRGVRVAHGVRKKLLLAIVPSLASGTVGGPLYVRLSRIRP